MTTELRKTGIPVVGDIPWGTHFCHFYQTKEDLLAILVPYFKAGLKNNEFCLWVVCNPLGLDEARAALKRIVPEADRHLAEGGIELVPDSFPLRPRQQTSSADAVEIVPYTKWYLKNGVFNAKLVIDRCREKLDEALARGYAGMRANGIEAWLTKENREDFGRYEQALDEALAGQRIIVLCSYPLADTGAAEILDVVRSHQFAVVRRKGSWEVVETPELKEAKSEIKRLNEELERRVVERTRELEAANEKLREEIAERKRAEEALRRSEDRTRLIIDTIPVMAWSVGPDGVVDFLNQRWVEYFGLSLEQYVVDQTAPIHPQDTPRVMEKWQAQRALGEGYDDEMRLRRADGEYRWFLVRTAPLRDERGSIVKWYGVSIDIEGRKRAGEALKESQRKLEEAQRIAHVGHYEYDLDTGVVVMSDEIYRIMGLQPQESITPSDPFEHIHPDDRERLHQVRDAALRDHKHFGVEYRIVRPDGAVRYLHSEGDVICDEAGRPRRIFGITQDITERKRAEEALQLFRNLLDQSSDGIEIVDPATLRFLDCNESAHRSLGYSREAFLALSVWDIDPALDQERLARSYDEIEKSGAATFETLHRRKDGSVFPVEVNVKLVRLERDYRLAVVRDITERKRAEEALQESNAKLELILNTSPLPIQSADADGRITSWNKAAERLFGWTEEEVVGRVCPTVPPEDIEEYLGMIRRVMQGETYVGLVRYRRKKDGGLLTCSISAAPQQNGRRELAGVTFIVEDITERKRAEEALRESQQLLQLVLATLPVGVMVTDQAGNIVLANAASKRIWGDIIISGPQRWAQTKGFWHDSGERVAPTAWASVRALSEGRASLNELIDIETYGGQQKTIENSAAPIRNAKGLIVGAVVVNEDVTERVRAEEQLKRSNEELRALSARLHMVREEESARIAREIHDELGAALSSLKWDLEEIDEEIAEITGPAPFAPLRAKVGALILRTDGTVDTVRRIASELRPTALEEFGLAEALRWHAGQFQARTGIVVTCDCRLDKAALNHEKSTAIFRIVQEALTNVLRHAQATRVDIAIRHTGDHCVLTIRDNGRGITEAEKSGPRSLGLLGMRERAYLLSGEISIEGAEGRGTVITVRVPASG